MIRVGFETTVSIGQRPQTYALDRAATGTGTLRLMIKVNTFISRLTSDPGNEFFG